MKHEIISFQTGSTLADYWLSHKVEWHIDRGLKLNLDASACLQGRPVAVEQINSLVQTQRKTFQAETRRSMLVVSSFHKSNDKYFQESHMFTK